MSTKERLHQLIDEMNEYEVFPDRVEMVIARHGREQFERKHGG